MKRNDKESGFRAPGTLVIVLIFFVFFVALYFANWVLLSNTWPVR